MQFSSDREPREPVNLKERKGPDPGHFTIRLTTIMAPQTTRLPNSLYEATLLAGTGGLLDSFVFLNHGHVFANAMTGNVVFLGIAVVGHHWREVIPYLLPILGFFIGIAASKILRSLSSQAAILALTLEILTLFLLGWAPADFPNKAFTGIVACVAALQVASFRRVDQFSFNSTFVTGNLRGAVEGFYDALSRSSTPESRKNGRIEAQDLGLICICFFLGAALGAWAAPRFANHSLWLAEPLLLLVALRVLRRSANSANSTPDAARTPATPSS
jgi:uncharacterized membrane protein YoaK (UPF0700 family)